MARLLLLLAVAAPTSCLSRSSPSPSLPLPSSPLLRPSQSPANPPVRSPNNSAITMEMFKRDFFFYERLLALLVGLASRAFSSFRRLLHRLLNFPPRVLVVSLEGVIAPPEEASSLRLQALAPELTETGLLGAPPVTSPSPFLSAPSIDGPARQINLKGCEKLFQRAFRGAGVRAVCLLINSPGGSPVQSSLIYERLRALRKRFSRVPVLAFVEDSACSGGYYIACAADEIIADPNSIIGSIGVISRGFGYVRAIERGGITRRVYTAGDSKSGLDPYLKERKKDLKQQRRVLHEIHDNFISAVKQGRGERLKPERAAELFHSSLHASSSVGCLPLWSASASPSSRKLCKLVKDGAGLFDGTVYSGAVALEIGLVDRLGEMHTEIRRRYGRFVRIQRIEPDLIDYRRFLRFFL